MIQLNLKCECGETTVVSEAAAGASLQCNCGRPIQVPPLHELRRLGGLTPIPETIPEAIQRKVVAGKIPSSRSCANCQMDTSQTVKLSAICEKSWSEESGSNLRDGTAVLIGLTSLAFGSSSGLLTNEDRPFEIEHHGRDVIVTLPIPFCDSCRATIPTAQAWLIWPRNVLLVAGLLCTLML